MSDDGSDGDERGHDPDLSEIERRARKRWLFTMVAIVVVVAILVPVLNPLLFGSDRHGASHHHHHPFVAAIAVVVTVVVVVSLALLIGRRFRRDEGMFAPMLIGGLSRRDRRAAAKAVRHGKPSSDPRLAAVERSTAERTLDQRGRTAVVFVIGCAGTAIEALVQHRLAARIYFGAGTVLFLGFLLLQLWTVRGARHYLAQAGSARE